MRKAFSMLEIVIVVMIVGILAAISKEIIPDTNLLKDTSYLFSKLKQTQSNALLGDNEKNCIELNTSKLNLKEKLESKNPKKYFFNEHTEIFILDSVLKGTQKKLCFDEEGRPYDSKTDLKHLIKKPFSIKISYKKESNEMIVMPYSGFITLK